MSHHEHHPDPHPELDALLARLLRDGSQMPDGLSDRVFHASRGHLPGAAPLAQLNAAEDAELETRLTEMLADQPVPAGLTDRVYAASAPLLPSRLRFPAASEQRWQRSRHVLGGRLAMAASVALVAMVGIWFAKMPGSPGFGSGSPEIALNDRQPADEPVSSDMSVRLASDVSMPTDADWRLLESVDHGHNEVRYLVESSGLSLQALAAELDAIVDRPGS